MDRRAFLLSSAYASAAAFSSRFAFCESAAAPIRLTLDPHKLGNPVAADFTGLSYESAQLSQPDFFSGTNTELIGLIRRLGASGVLRVGGNTSEYCDWAPGGAPARGVSERDRDQANVLQQAIGPDKGHHPPPRRAITPEAVRNLADFVHATGWKLIYGLNMGTGTPEEAAAEAAYVTETIGDRLIAFQLCNEPDLFNRNGLRPRDWSYAQFAGEWQHFHRVIRKRLSNAPFAGPDTAYNNEWLVPFAKQFKNEVSFLTQHYYAEGPPTDPSMTIERLLAPNPKLALEFQGMAETKAASGLPFRLAETNSCYQGGKQGVSNTFASALWGANLMYQLATAGGVGINFHGGGYGWYTPIAGTIADGFVARPIYYGMLLFAEAGAGHLIDARLEGNDSLPLLTVYGLINDAVEPRDTISAILFNQDSTQDARVTIDCGERTNAVSVLRLLAPELDDTQDVTLGANPVGDSGAWTAQRHEAPPLHGGVAMLDLPAGSGALVKFHIGGYK